jgi:hypothetical protein
MNSSNDEHTKWNKQQKSNEKLLSCSVELPSIDKTLKAGRRTITRHMLCAKITNTQTTCRWSLRHKKTNKPFHIKVTVLVVSHSSTFQIKLLSFTIGNGLFFHTNVCTTVIISIHMIRYYFSSLSSGIGKFITCDFHPGCISSIYNVQ